MKPIGSLEERNNLFHTGQSFFTGDVSAVDTCQYSHNSETTATGSYYVLVIFGIDAVHMDALTCQSAVRFGTFPEIVEGAALYGIHQCFVAYGTGFYCRAFTLCKA